MDLKKLFGYEGKTVVVSGAYSGMGLAAARLLQELGANVYTICRRNGRHSKLDFPVAGELYADFGVKADLDALAEWVKQTRGHVHHWFMVEDLFHLKRGGRVSTVEAMVGSALKIKPILSVDEEGKLVIRSKARGTNKAMEYLIAKTVEEGGDLSTLRAVIGHADCIEKAEKLKQMAVDAGMQADNLMIAPIGPIIGTHVGSGMLAIAFVTNM